MTKKLLMGNEAMAYAALEAGVGVVAGYPGTPSSEIVETIGRQVRRGAAHGVHVEWSANEKVALELLFGASLAGKRALFTCKQMGLNVASDALMSLNYVGVRGGLVLIVADDPGPISSQTEQDTRRFAAFAKVPVLDPVSPEQAYDMVKIAFVLSERFHTPVIVRPTTRIDHASTFLDVADETTSLISVAAPSPDGIDPAASAGLSGPVPEPGFVHDPKRLIIFPQRSFQAHGEINARLAAIAEAYSTEEPFTKFNLKYDMEAEENRRASKAGDDQASGTLQARQRAHASIATGSPTLGILAGGISASYAREALQIVAKRARRAGIRMPAYRFMQVATPYPFPETAIADFTKGLSDVLVLEELDYVLEDELARLVGRAHLPLNVCGKLTGDVRDRGENDVDDAAVRIERFLGLTGRLSLARARAKTQAAYLSTTQATIIDDPASTGTVTPDSTGGTPPSQAGTVRLGPAAEASLPTRPPVLCAGCPHRGAFHAVKTALDDTPAVLCGDIGCYTLGNAAPLEAVDTCLCMGAGITMAQGIAAADPGKKAIAYVGDSTFFASGMPGLANATYNGHDSTVMVLDNSTTAMTGAQPHPGTGATLMGGRNDPLDIEAVLAANGFGRIFHANPLDRDSSVIAVRAAIAYEGPSAVIFESPCAQIIPPDSPVRVNTDACTGCKRCITSIGCPAVSFNEKATGPRSRNRGQAVIDTSLCVGCNLCTQVCPFKAIQAMAPQTSAESKSASGKIDMGASPTTLEEGGAND